MVRVRLIERKGEITNERMKRMLKKNSFNEFFGRQRRGRGRERERERVCVYKRERERERERCV